LAIGCSGAHLDVPVALVQRAEELGYDSVWSAEAYGSDAITPLAFLAAKTNRIKLGTGIMQLAARTPANAASIEAIEVMAKAARLNWVVSGRMDHAPATRRHFAISSGSAPLRSRSRQIS
jgi:hypothetical protein